MGNVMTGPSFWNLSCGSSSHFQLLTVTFDLKMPQKRDRIRDFLFNRSRNPSPIPQDQRNPLSQAGSSSTVSPVSTWNPLTQVSPSTESNANEMASAAWEGVKTALVLVKKSSD